MKTMLITGTTQGIGNALYHYYKERYRVITVNRRIFEGENYICNLSDLNEVHWLQRKINSLNIDILINNAGGACPGLFSEMKIEELIACTNLNYHAPVLLMQAVLEGMKQRDYGRIVNISSISSKSPRTLIPHYGAAKSALERFSSSMAVAYGGYGITVNCICPGGVDTKTSFKNRKQMANIAGKDEDYYNRKMVSENGLGRMIDTLEIVNLVDFLVSDRAVAISGQVYNICGIKEVH